MLLPKLNQELIDMELPIGTILRFSQDSPIDMCIVRKTKPPKASDLEVSYDGSSFPSYWTLIASPWVMGFEVPKVFTDQEYKEFFV